MKKIRLEDLTLREKIGQTVCVRENLIAEVPNLVEHLKDYPYGCMWAMGNQLNNTENMSEATDKSGKATARGYLETSRKIMSATKVPMLMAGNTESGFSSLFSELSDNMGQMAIAATDSEGLIFEQAAAIAREMRSSGVQWKWSPILDIDNLLCFGLYGRGFSDDPDKIVRYATASVKGTQSERVAATIKHFPGNDFVEYRDPHFTTTFNMQTREEWDRTNGYVYKEVIKNANPWAVMVGHQALPCFDNTKMPDGTYIPTTLSKKTINELLKGELGFEGVVITDAIGMTALHNYMSENELYINLILAGNDMILGPTFRATDNFIDVVEKAVLEGRIPESRIDDACSRVLKMKERIGMFDEDFGLDIEPTPELLEATAIIEQKAAKKAVTLVKNRGILPLSKVKIKNVLIAPLSYVKEFDEAMCYTGELLKARGIAVDYVLPEDKLSALDMDKYDVVLVASYLRAHRPIGCSGYNASHQSTLFYLQNYANDKTITVGYGSPHVYFDYFVGTGKAFVAAYDYTRPLQEAVVSALFGEIDFEGKCPFSLTPDFIRNNPFT